MIGGDAMVRAVTRLMQPLQRRVLLMVGRAVIEAVNDQPGVQLVNHTALNGEVKDGDERFQEYGFTSKPFPGAEDIFICVGGNRDHAIVIACEDKRYRLKGMADGEVALYDDQGQKVHLKRNGIAVESPVNILLKTDGILRLDADGIEIHGRSYVQTDVAGKGQRETNTGGANFFTDSYTTGATTDGAEHGLDQPHIPSDHPDGPDAE